SHFIFAVPKDFFRLEIEGAQALFCAREIDCVTLEISAEAAEPFFDGKLDAPHETVSVINVEDENSLARTSDLRSIRGAHVKIAFERTLRERQHRKNQDPEDEDEFHGNEATDFQARRQRAPAHSPLKKAKKTGMTSVVFAPTKPHHC